MDRLREHGWLLVVLAVCALIYFHGLGDIAFLGKDEPKNAQAAREMFERGDWVTTTLAGEPWYDKPILYYWTALVGYHLIGIGELAARLGPALAGLLSVLLTFLLGRRLLGHTRDGALAALVLGSGIEFFWFARTAVTDALLACCVTAALTCYLFAREGVRPAWNLPLAWGFTGLATLAKGPIGLLLPAMVIGSDILLRRDWRRLREMRWLSGGAVFLAVAAPWYTLVILRSDGQFFQDFILHYNLERFTTENLPHPGPFYYYLPILLLGPFPWSVFLPASLVRIARERSRLRPQERERLHFLLLWVAVPLLFFSLAGSKLPSYLLPTFPAVAILIAREIRDLLRAPGRAMPRPLTLSIALFALASVGLAAGGGIYLAEVGETELQAALPLLGVLLGTGLAALATLLARRRRAAVATVCAAAILVPLAITTWGLEPAESTASAKAIALEAIALEPGPGRLLSFRFHDNSFFFYTDSTVEKLNRRADIEARVAREGSVLCFVRRQDRADLVASPRFRAEELGVGGKIYLMRLVARTEPPADG